MAGLVSRYNGLYRDRGGLEAAGLLYCNTPWCIETEGARDRTLCRDTAGGQATTRRWRGGTQPQHGLLRAATRPSPLQHGLYDHDTAPLRP